MSERSVRPFYFEEIEYDPLRDTLHGYTVVIEETMRLGHLELWELNPKRSEQIDKAAHAQARQEEYDRTTDRRLTREHFQKQ